MTQQIKPQQITTRIEQLEKTQKSKGYEPGWVSHQLKSLCESKAKHLTAYSQGTFDCYISYLGYKFAADQMLMSEVKEELKRVYEENQASEEMFVNWS